MNPAAYPDRAIVLAAGLGTRLRPLTLKRPKPLMPFWGKPILEHTLDLLTAWGVRDVLINLHHGAPELVRWAQAFRHDEVRAGRVELDARWRRMIVDAVESADLDVDARMFALEFSALLDGLSIQVALEDPEVDSKVAYDIAMRFAERELNLPADRKRARAR